jgi:homocitrate synthase NifV
MNITDAALCAVSLEERPADGIRDYYMALLDLGVTYVQIPFDAIAPLDGCLIPGRTVLSLPRGWKGSPPAGYAGYLYADRSKPADMVIRETSFGRRVKAKKLRWLADESLFFKDYEALFKAGIKGQTDIEFCARGADCYGTALTVEWVRSGGQSIVTGFAGAGGYAPLEQVLMALHCEGHLLNGLSLHNLAILTRAFEATGKPVHPHQPVIGARVFDVESGVHVDGLLKDKTSYEPFAPETVGAKRYIVLGESSGKSAVRAKIEQLGLGSCGCDMERLLDMVRSHGGLTDEAFALLVSAAKEGDAA